MYNFTAHFSSLEEVSYVMLYFVVVILYYAMLFTCTIFLPFMRVSMRARNGFPCVGTHLA